MDPENEIQEEKAEPDIDALKADLERCRTNLNYYNDRAEEARDCRRDIWPGKGRYGKKEGPDSFPFEGASDLESNLVGSLVDGDVAVLKSALVKSNLSAAPIEFSDIGTAKIVSEFLKWRLGTMEEFQREVSVAANFLLEQGICFLGVYFKREITRVYQPISIDQISQQSPELALAINDPNMQDSVSELVKTNFPNLKKPRINKMIRELRKDGITEIPTEKIKSNRPAIRAYELGRDLIIDANVLDLQSARAIYCIHFFTPEQLQEKVITEGFDQDFVNDAIERSTGEFDTSYQGTFEGLYPTDNEAPENYDGLIKLITCYRKEIDEDLVPVCNVTIFSENVEGYAKSYRMNEDGDFPFVAITREQISRRLLDSRGYPELLRSYQIAVKTEMDQRRDAASMSTLPPIEHLVGRAPPALGPGATVAVRRRGEVGFLETGLRNSAPASTEVEMQIRQLADKLTGRPTSQLDAVDSQILRQSMVNNWLNGFTQVLKKIWMLDRTYNQNIWFRVTGSEEGMAIVMDETASEYDFQLSFNAMNNDEQVVLDKLKTIGEVMSSFDRNGTARFDVYLKTFLQAIDPLMASQLLLPKEEATNKEVLETSMDLAKIASGQVVNVPQNANPQLRLQVLQSYIEGSENIPAEDVQQRLQEDEKFRQRLETYQKQLTFAIQQQQNALTGKLGTPPGNVPGSVAA